ncbi:MAG TPA: protein-methionine-sulfoxide reductase heme-binding subunit MsrQ [Candidatus Binatia bacterium]
MAPLALLAYYAYTGNLGANPIEVVTHWTGDSTIIFLLITLTVTPLRKISGWNDAIKFRRMLGLFAFFYVCLHFTTYIWLDQFFDLRGIVKDVAKRPFITLGFASFVLLIPLAMTSTAAMVRRLGKRWQKLHRLIYIIAAGGVIHYWWLVKKDIRWPLTYAVILGVLLGYRFCSVSVFSKIINRVRLSMFPLEEKV